MIVPGFETRKYGPKKTLKIWWLVIDLYRIVGKAVLHSRLEHWYIGSSWDSYSSWFRGRNSSMGEVVVAKRDPDMGRGRGQQGVLRQGSVVISFLLFLG